MDNELKEKYIAKARDFYVTDEVEIDDNPKISEAIDDGSGCWVAAWVWVGKDDL